MDWLLCFFGVGNVLVVELGLLMLVIECGGCLWLIIDCGGEGFIVFKVYYGYMLQVLFVIYVYLDYVVGFECLFVDIFFNVY